MAGFSDAPFVQTIAVPAVCMLIAFLGYGSQLIFRYSSLEPGALTNKQTIVFNISLGILWLTYARAVLVDPGRYVFPETVIEIDADADDEKNSPVGRWCKKCQAPKPLRSHHCKHCMRCIPRMDHHCPWTKNCVSMTTFPHFLRFLIYANVSLWMLGRFLWDRFAALYDARNLPAYLGPTLLSLIGIAMVSLVWFVTTFALGIMLATTVKSWLFNQTMIEGWEIDRHEAIVDRAGRDWWDIMGPDGKKIRFERVEFPYDVGFFTNMAQAMGTNNVLLWFFPLAGNPKVSTRDKAGTGWTWPENGFNRKTGLWPPPDPDKIRRANREWPAARRNFAAELEELDLSPEEQKRAFQQRQANDLRRRNMLVAELEEVDGYDVVDGADATARGEIGAAPEKGFDGKAGWTNSDGDRLGDYGVDEDAEDDAAQDDEVPLAELLRRRQAANGS